MSDMDENLVSVGVAIDGWRKRTVKLTNSGISKQKKYGQPKVFDTFLSCPQITPRFQCCKFTPSDCTRLRKSLLPLKGKYKQVKSHVQWFASRREY